MNIVDEILCNIASDSLLGCKSLLKSFADIKIENKIQFLLESEHGLLLSTPNGNNKTTTKYINQNLLSALVPRGDLDENIALLFTPRRCEFVGSFSVNNLIFYPAITLNDPPINNYAFRYELQAHLGCFSQKCYNVFKEYLNSFKSVDKLSQSHLGQNIEETCVLKQIAAYSPRIYCVALLDEDGFVLKTFGSADKVEEVAYNLATFYNRTVKTLSQIGSINTKSIRFGGDQRTVLISKIQNTNLTLAISIYDDKGWAIAGFLNSLAQSAFQELIKKNGKLWGAHVEAEKNQLRARDSWFKLPQLVPQDKYINLKGSKVFHIPSCSSLIKIDEAKLRWINSRHQAIQDQLNPCNFCHP